MSDKLDYKKQFKELYQPGKSPAFVRVPPILYLMAEGSGAPEGENYQTAVQLLYTLSYTIKMSKMGDQKPQGYFEYVVPPLEGLWATKPEIDRNLWKWTSMLRQPDFVTGQVLAQAVQKARAKHPALPFERARLEVYEEGDCVQCMHVGLYSEEPATVEKMQAYMAQHHLREDFASGRLHHEIYLTDPKKTPAEKQKTVLRLPVASIPDEGVSA